VLEEYTGQCNYCHFVSHFYCISVELHSMLVPVIFSVSVFTRYQIQLVSVILVGNIGV